jgi:hypothetical protein
MQIQEFLHHVDRGETIEAGSEGHQFMHGVARHFVVVPVSGSLTPNARSCRRRRAVLAAGPLPQISAAIVRCGQPAAAIRAIAPPSRSLGRRPVLASA